MDAIDQRKRKARIRSRFICKGCGVCTNAANEYYMVHFHLWIQAARFYGFKGLAGMLCIGCVEEALGRRLSQSDFIPYPVNMEGQKQSSRLADRLLGFNVRQGEQAMLNAKWTGIHNQIKRELIKGRKEITIYSDAGRRNLIG